MFKLGSLHEANGGSHTAELEANRARSLAEDAARTEAIKKAAEDSGLLVMKAETAQNLENAALHGVIEAAPNAVELAVLPPVQDPEAAQHVHEA